MLSIALGLATAALMPIQPRAASLTAIVNFDGTDGAFPVGLIAGADGNLFGTRDGGGVNGDGTVYELTGSGFVPPAVFAGMPGKPNCLGKSVSALARRYGGLHAAAVALGYADVRDLLNAIAAHCEG